MEYGGQGETVYCLLGCFQTPHRLSRTQGFFSNLILTSVTLGDILAILPSSPY